MAISDATMSAVRQLLTAAGAVLAGFGIKSFDAATATTLANDLAVIIPAVVSAASILWSVWAAYGKKKVPVAATAVILPPSVPVPPIGNLVNLKTVDTAKVVG